MPTISNLGHVGLYCSDLALQEAFYTGVLGLHKTDEDPKHGLVFLSAQPDVEHHELLLVAGRNVGPDAHVVQQISFRCATLADVLGFFQRFRDRSVSIDMVVTHGNAVGVYFYDPEGNRCEVYWPTQLLARQPFVVPVDLDQEPEQLLRDIAALVELHGQTGIFPDSLLAAQEIGTQP